MPSLVCICICSCVCLLGMCVLASATKTILLFPAPFQVYQLSSDHPNPPEHLSKSLASLATSNWNAYKDSLGQHTKGSAKGNTKGNSHHKESGFYEYQLQHPSIYQSSPAYQTLLSVAHLFFTDTLESFFPDPSVGSAAPLVPSDIFCWSTIGGDPTHSTSWHAPHTHANSALSLVYYAQAYPGHAPITFTDPRGSWSGGIFEFAPETDEIIVFPSYLTHFIGPSDDKIGTRISWSCNAPGSWTDTTNLHLEL